MVVKGKSEEIEKIFYNYTGFVYHYMMFVFMLLYVFILVLYPGINSFLSAVLLVGMVRMANWLALKCVDANYIECTERQFSIVVSVGAICIMLLLMFILTGEYGYWDYIGITLSVIVGFYISLGTLIKSNSFLDMLKEIKAGFYVDKINVGRTILIFLSFVILIVLSYILPVMIKEDISRDIQMGIGLGCIIFLGLSVFSLLVWPGAARIEKIFFKNQMNWKCMKNKQKQFLEPLTPIVLDEEHKELQSYKNYEKALDEAFSCNEICNIALTGAYGAGKSTIMQTYESEHKKNYIHISLAKFGEEVDPTKGHFTQRELEIKIINQIIHQISEQEIPQTKFRTKKEIGRGTMWLYTSLLFLLIVSLWYLFVVPSAMWDKEEVSTLYQAFTANKWNYVVLAVALGAIFMLLYFIVKRQMISPLIKSVQVDKSKIELADTSKDKDEHQFNRYMDELIYIFKNGKIDAVVLDDIDRFGQLEIFSELREMNYLINKKLELLTKKNQEIKKVKFFYMVKDELFTDFEERTKFFDLIIPIVPAMDSSNSFELFKELMTEDGNLVKEAVVLDMKYIQMICLDIHDYRVLKNICNEYKIFYHQLRVSELQLVPTKLFAMVTYKNLWPEDYAKLQRKNGSVYDKIHNIEELQQEKRKEVEEEINKIQVAIEEADREQIENLDDLACVYFKNPAGCQTAGYFILNGKSQWEYTLHKDFLSELRKADSVIWRAEDYYGSPRRTTYTKNDIQSWFEKMEANPEYAHRKLIITRKGIEWKQKKEKEIESLKEKILQIEMMTLSDFLTENGNNIETLLTDEKDKKTNAAIRTLVAIFLKDGMIGDDYQSYMTYFYPFSLSAEEVAYLNCVRTGNKEKSLTLEIKNIDLIMEHLRPQDYKSKALPNFNLLYLAMNKRLKQVVESTFAILQVEKRTEFVLDFCNMYSEYSIQSMMEYWPNLLNEILLDKYITWNEKKHILFQVLQYGLPFEQRPKGESRDVLTSHETEIIRDCSIKQLENYLAFGIAVGDLVTPEISEEKRDLICAEHAFVCNEANVVCYLEKNAENKEAAALDILNDEWLQYGEKQAFIKLMRDVVIQDISKVENDLYAPEEYSTDLWCLLLKENKVAFNSNNILVAWERDRWFSEGLFVFMKFHFERNTCGLSYKKIREFFGEDEKEAELTKKMVNQIYVFENFGTGYVPLLLGLNVYYETFDFENIDKKNLEVILRKTSIIRMNEAHLLKVRKEWETDVLMDWITKQISRYCVLMKSEKLHVEKELQSLIQDDRVMEETKCTLITYCKEPIMIQDSYNSVIVQKILETEKFAGNYGVLFNRYIPEQRYSKEVKTLIEDYSIRHIKEIIPLRTRVPQRIMELVLEDGRVTQADKKLLIAKQVDYLIKPLLDNMLSQLYESEFLNVVRGKQVKVSTNEANQILLDALVRKGWVSSYKADEEMYIVYPKRNMR